MDRDDIAFWIEGLEAYRLPGHLLDGHEETIENIRECLFGRPITVDAGRSDTWNDIRILQMQEQLGGVRS
jgi:hypothetical protein